ncbi:hypothetical protein OJ996_14470 [Luteolibacter sp. GHJ8]|uniref:DNA binding HTH domain-containing protein n=1 Tax=Luteolibacter rhizosphaerae TaxID=2989719 RepID=A0ABT3G4M6_9BACT|nr:helix-turn-helix domain-containing protein [Luteolibacter rhizosphaerae]MCW1914788.1 hypothetical protein [Luteolibacter rhizosphaerae]
MNSPLPHVSAAPPLDGRGLIRLKEAREHLERQMVSDSLARNGGSITAAANELGISRTVICELIAKLGIAAA